MFARFFNSHAKTQNLEPMPESSKDSKKQQEKRRIMDEVIKAAATRQITPAGTIYW